MSAPDYQNPWVEIEPERLAAYDELFAWNPATAPLLAAADIGKGHVVADFGCGPGHMTVELAEWVGPTGHVHAFDINAEFLALTLDKATARGVEGRVTLHQSDGYGLSLAAQSLDRVVTRNTLVFADEPEVIFKEFRRVLKRGGKAHAIEGDWLLMAVEPVPTADWHAFVAAASHACRLPDIGRKLYGIARRAGFGNVAIDVVSKPDTTGRLMPMIRNMADYARLGGLEAARIEALLASCEAAITSGEFLAVAPQFVVTAGDGPAPPTGHWM
jgi:ubiquinone/menaquinone biosynthesis C-methylase UbiE